ncbi:lipoprotein LpqH [Nocardia sp. NBC_00508]|uniref:lipoprotein LpqH n=1 Tax=Nocardia sp. NBC_00508 TaxID=2975992 RepID=UPI002E80E19C|nr:lipoprotein LpqH [Nocardia sp. NBC_00508]WUD69278.1 lipoprotein LpqH [Nocardia sp. NBC_00508]
MNSIRFASAALAASAAVALLVTGCSDDASTSTAPPSSAQPGPAAPAGKSIASVDGKAFDAKFTTTCARQGGTLALALTDTDNSAYGNLSVSATITDADTVQAVAIAGSKGGDNGLPYAIGFGNGMPGGSATVVKDGNSYKVTGEGVGAPDLTNPLAGPKASKFEITFACSSIVGA